MVSSIVLMTVLTAGAPPVLTSAPAKIYGLGRQSRSCGSRQARGCGRGCGTVNYTLCGATVGYAPVTSCTAGATPCAPVVTHSA
ncbi:MAG: hypothetical protein SNJ75_16810, partial [Gemmataceae bacterium]